METGTVKQIRGLALITAVCLLGDSFLYVALPVFWRDLGLLSIWEVGVLLSINRLIRLPLHPFIGWIYSRISIQSGIIVAVVLAGVSTIGYGAVHSFTGFLVLRVLWGVAWTLLRQGAYVAIFSANESIQKGHLIGTYNGLYRVGSLVGVLVGGILTEWVSFSRIVTVFGLLTIPVVPVLMRYLRGGKTTAVDPNARSRQGISFGSMNFFISRQIVIVISTAFLVAMLFQGIVTSSVSRLISVYVGSVSWAGIIWGAASVAGVLHALRWGWEPWVSPFIGKKLDVQSSNNRNLFLTTVFFVNAVLFCLVSITASHLLFIVLLLMIQFFATVLTTSMDVQLNGIITNENKTVLISTFALAVDAGAALGPLLGFVLTEQQLFAVSAGILFSLSGLWFLSQVMNKPKQINHTNIIEPK